MVTQRVPSSSRRSQAGWSGGMSPVCQEWISGSAGSLLVTGCTGSILRLPLRLDSEDEDEIEDDCFSSSYQALRSSPKIWNSPWRVVWVRMFRALTWLRASFSEIPKSSATSLGDIHSKK